MDATSNNGDSLARPGLVELFASRSRNLCWSRLRSISIAEGLNVNGTGGLGIVGVGFVCEMGMDFGGGMDGLLVGRFLAGGRLNRGVISTIGGGDPTLLSTGFTTFPLNSFLRSVSLVRAILSSDHPACFASALSSLALIIYLNRHALLVIK